MNVLHARPSPPKLPRIAMEKMLGESSKEVIIIERIMVMNMMNIMNKKMDIWEHIKIRTISCGPLRF